MAAGTAAFTAFCSEDLSDGADVVDEVWRVALFCALADASGTGPTFCTEFLDGTGVRGRVDDV